MTTYWNISTYNPTKSQNIFPLKIMKGVKALFFFILSPEHFFYYLILSGTATIHTLLFRKKNMDSHLHSHPIKNLLI